MNSELSRITFVVRDLDSMEDCIACRVPRRLPPSKIKRARGPEKKQT